MACFSLEPNGTNSISQSFKMHLSASSHTRSEKKTVQSCSPHPCQASSSVPRVENALDLPVGLASVQPLATLEDGGDRVGRVGHLDALQIPAAVGAVVVVLHLDPQQLPEVQHLHDKAVRAPLLEQVAELLPQLALARVPVDAEDGDENVGVCARPFDVPGDHDDFVLDRDEFADFACEALDGLETLKGHELVFFGCQWNFSITVEEIP